MFIRRAKLVELDSIMGIYEIARRYMMKTANDKQWGKSYPPREMVEEDIRAGHLYVCIGQDDEVHGVFALIEGQDPTYLKIEGK